MAKDLTIRLLGRPQVTKDDQVGYHKVTRQYVIEGYRASYAQINDPTNPLFLAVGTEDEEFSEHYLVNQKVTPKQGSVDTAYLTREFAELRGTYIQESVTTSNDLRRIRRTYVVLRGVSPENTNIGYSSVNFDKHPDNSSQNYEPWAYVPEAIVAPGSVQLNNPTTNSLGEKIPSLGEGTDDNPPSTLYSILENPDYDEVVNYAVWLKGGAQVSRSRPGVDVWSVEWVTHGNPYWVTGTQRGRGLSTPIPKVVEFDHLGLRIADFGSAGTSSSLTQVASYVFYVTSDVIPSSLSTYWGGGNIMTPSVMFDCEIINADSVSSVAFRMSKTIPNAVFKGTTNAGLKFPTYQAWKDSGTSNKSNLPLSVQTMTQEGKLRVFLGDLAEVANAYDTIPEQQIYVKAKAQVTIPEHEKLNYNKLPAYKGLPIRYAAGTLSYTQGYNGTYSFATPVSVKVRPIFTPSDTADTRKIWQVEITYVG